ncbi:hypothetical protein DPMN_151137 [Dreissena polymorpha]|uniref:Uncharacterized protein n=1 Tax=Dreissena polymorpha TaxID=45954 RepID=A0A9D4J676_DREPO|nr:hypothetical protein DPMN_151137 [Dreissena polymorpha]
MPNAVSVALDHACACATNIQKQRCPPFVALQLRKKLLTRLRMALDPYLYDTARLVYTVSSTLLIIPISLLGL